MATIARLEARREKRVRKRKHHHEANRRFKAQGKRGKAAWHAVRLKLQVRAIRKLDRLIVKVKTRQEAARRNAYVNGPWGGAEAILVYEVIPFIEKIRSTGLETSGKRWETYGNPSSDHYAGNKHASARDFALVNDHDAAARLFAHLTGKPASEWGGDYSSFYFERYGVTFRGQIIAGTHGTGPHLHTGFARS